jgi:hypothetical protein
LKTFCAKPARQAEPDLFTNGGQMNNRDLVFLVTGKPPINKEALENERKERVRKLLAKKSKKKSEATTGRGAIQPTKEE